MCCGDSTRPDVVIAVSQVHARGLTRLDGDHTGVVWLTALTSISAEGLDELERVCPLAGLRVDWSTVRAVACCILLVHDSVEVLSHDLVACIHLHGAVRHVVRRNMWWDNVGCCVAQLATGWVPHSRSGWRRLEA